MLARRLIRTALAVAIGIVGGCGSTPPSAMEGVGGGVDLEDVEPILRRVAALVERGFSEQDAKSLSSEISAQVVQSKREYRRRVRFSGADIELQVVAFLDDVDAVDIDFITHPALAQLIDKSIAEHMESVGK